MIHNISHDAEKVYRVFGRTIGWTCSKDGGWAFGIGGYHISRLHEELPFALAAGPWIYYERSKLTFAKLKLLPADRHRA